MQTIIYNIDKQQGPTVQHKEQDIQYPVINQNRRENQKECIYDWITLLYSKHQHNTINQL